MTPTQPLAALAVGTLLGLAAWMAPDPSSQAGDDSIVCATDCTGSRHPDLPAVGTLADGAAVRIVTRPGQFGLSTPPAGQRYAVLSGHLVRVDAATNMILSVLRPAPDFAD